MHHVASMDKYPELERCESTATSTGDTPHSGQGAHIVASPHTAKINAAKNPPPKPSPSFSQDPTGASATLHQLGVTVAEMSESLRYLTTMVESLSNVTPRGRTAAPVSLLSPHGGLQQQQPKSFVSDAAPPVLEYENSGAMHRSSSRAPMSRAASDANGRNDRDDASHIGSTTEKSRTRRKWRRVSTGESFLGMDMLSAAPSKPESRQRSAVLQFDQATGRVTEIPMTAGAGGFQIPGSYSGQKAITDKSSERSKGRTGAVSGGSAGGGGGGETALELNPSAHGPSASPSVVSQFQPPPPEVPQSPPKSRTRTSAPLQQGLMEDEPVVVLCDMLYVILATAVSVVTISAVNPRIDILNTPGLFYTALSLYVFTTLFTFCWVALRCFVQVRRGEWEIIDNTKDIRKRYLSTWFLFDLLYTVPIEYIFIGWNWDVYFYLQTRHFLRLIRLVFLGASGNPLRETRSWFRFVTFIVAYGLIVHSVASGFGAVENHDYLDSLYWTILTMATVGYGDVVPLTDGGKIYCIFAMLLGVSLMSILTAFATQYITGKDRMRADIEQKKSLLNSMLQWYDVPWPVQRDIILMFPAVLDTQAEESFRNLCEGMPKCVTIKIDHYAKIKLLKTVSFFKNFHNEEALFELSKLLTKRFVPNQQFIVLAGEIGKEMFFIIRGVVEVIVPDPDDRDEEEVVATLHSGEYFGEIALVDDLTRTASVQAVTLCELWVLEKADLMQLCLLYEDLGHAIRTIANNRINDMKERQRIAQQGIFENADEHLMGLTPPESSFKLDPDEVNPLGPNMVSPRSDKPPSQRVASPSQDFSAL